MGVAVKKDEYFRNMEFDVNLPDEMYKIIRLDGRGFSKLTKGMNKPFDLDFCEWMDITAIALCHEIQGATLAYTQSDEISVVIPPPATQKAQQWFGGSVSKTLSISAATASTVMTRAAGRTSVFDSRVVLVASRTGVLQYLTWRQDDAHRNAISMAAEHYFPSKALLGVNTYQRVAMLEDLHGIDFYRQYSDFLWKGRIIKPETVTEPVTFTHKKTGEEITQDCERTRWEADCAPWFENAGEGIIP